MESRFSAVVKAGVDMMTPERVFAGIGFVTIGAFLVDRCLSISATARQAHLLDSSDFDLMKKRLEQIQELCTSVDKLKNADTLESALEEINNAIREFHKTIEKREAAELTTNKKKYAKLLYKRAEIYYLMRNYKRALVDLTAALTDDATLVSAKNLLLHLYADSEELRNLKTAQEMLAHSTTANPEQTFAKYYRAVLDVESFDLELVNRLAQQLIVDLQNPECATRDTIPEVVLPHLLSRCLRLNIERAENASILKNEIEKMSELLSVNGLVVNQHLRLVMTESILHARLRMAQLMNQHDMHCKHDMDELRRNTYRTNQSNALVGCLENTKIMANFVIDKIIQQPLCGQYLLKPEHRDELCAVMKGFAELGKFNDPVHADLLQKINELETLQEDELAALCASFVSYIQKQSLEVWTLAVSEGEEGNIHSLLRIACAEKKIDLQIYFNSEDTLTCIREYRHQSDEVERTGANVISVVMSEELNRLKFILPLTSSAAQQQYLVLKECERVLALDPENKTINNLLGQIGFSRISNKAVYHHSSQSLFSRYKYPLLVLGALAAAALGSAVLFKRQ